MSFRTEHPQHQKRLGRNVGVALCLVAFVVLITWLSIVKMLDTGVVQGADHSDNPVILDQEGAIE